MNKTSDRRSKIGLILLFAGITFAVLILFMLFQAVVLIILFKSEVLTFVSDLSVRPSLLLFLFALFCLIVGAGLSFLLSRILTGPINKIIRAINLLASGDYKARLNIGSTLSRHPTIVYLTDLFNKMAEALDHNQTLKDDFINNFSHEFKTPIVSIMGFAKLLANEDLTENQHEYASIILEESKRLANMAKGVLELSRIENQSQTFQTQRFNLSEQIRNCVLILENKWSKKNLCPVLDFDEYEIVANEDMLSHVWLNLIDNAVKFSFDNSDFKIDINKIESEICVSVTNEGKTIPPNQLPYIFHKFYQADKSHAGEGNGIGLAIVQKIVLLHGGRVEVESKNNSTSFSVFLPSSLKISEHR